MGIMLAFPEYLVGISTTNLFASWVNTPELKELAEVDNVPWSLTHTILANMGGIAIRFTEHSKEEVLEQNFQKTSGSSDLISSAKPISDLERCDQVPRSMVHGSVMQPETEVEQADVSSTAKADDASSQRTLPRSEGMPKFIQDFQKNQERHLRGLGEIPWAQFRPHLALAANARLTTHWPTQNIDMATLHGNIWILDSKQLALARRSGVIQKLPSLTEEEIADRSKSDGLVRLLAVVQVLWLAVQLIIRRFAKIPFAALEISTVAFSSCAFIIYMTEWSKPKDVGVPFYLDTDAVVSPAVFSLIAKAAPTIFLQARHYYIAQSGVHQVVEGQFHKKDVDRLMILTSILSIALFGGIHLFAWDLEFPTHIEKLLWRSAALTVAVAPTISALLVLLESIISHRTDKISKWSVMVLGPAYLAARLFIIVESFRSLYFLPPKAFISTWAANAPYIT